MFWKKEEPDLLDSVVTNAVSVLMLHKKESAEYARQLDNVIKLLELRVQRDTRSSVSKDTWANVGANLLGIFMIVKHEHVNVIASKALGFVTKTRVT